MTDEVKAREIAEKFLLSLGHIITNNDAGWHCQNCQYVFSLGSVCLIVDGEEQKKYYYIDADDNQYSNLFLPNFPVHFFNLTSIPEAIKTTFIHFLKTTSTSIPQAIKTTFRCEEMVIRDIIT